MNKIAITMKEVDIITLMEYMNFSLRAENLTLDGYIESLGGVEESVLSKTITISNGVKGNFIIDINNVFDSVIRYFSVKLCIPYNVAIDTYIESMVTIGSPIYKKNLVIETAEIFIDTLRVSKLVTKADLNVLMDYYTDRESINVFYKLTKEFRAVRDCARTLETKFIKIKGCE